MGTAVGTVLADLASGALLAVIFGTGMLGFAVYFLLGIHSAWAASRG
jgi:hypothetical protein